MNKKMIVTSALPYANGALHLGHLVEYLQTDFWVRFQKMMGNRCVYMCADDTHGTPIMIRARKEGITPEELLADSYAQHTKDFADFEVTFDRYGSTNCDENRHLSETIYTALKDKGRISTRVVNQLYCENDKMFLPDRFVKGVCPKCGAKDQYGDSCDACGATYGAAELVEPYCSVCGAKPVMRDSDQLFFELEPSRDFLQKWIPQHVEASVSNKLMEWFGEPLRGWNISRDAPYFGFKIPGYSDKYFYVWMDAPVGYMATLKQWCDVNNESFEAWWQNPDAEIYHFIGKDIVRFHCLFWPTVLEESGFRTPNEVFVHGFLTVNGEKMSKSKGTFISARTYLNHLPAQALRFYYACKLNGTTDDLDLNLGDFVDRVNSDLVGKITNLASRGAQMLHKHFNGLLAQMDDEGRALFQTLLTRQDAIAAAYKNRDFCRVMVAMREMADEANRYFDAKAPWVLIKTDPAATQQILTTTLNIFRYFAICLKPILPSYTDKVEAMFGEEPFVWSSTQMVRENCTIGPYAYLATRLDPKSVQAVVDASKQDLQATTQPIAATSKKAKPAKKASAPLPFPEPIAETIDIDTFAKLDLRVGKVVSAEVVDGSDKLLRVLIDIAEEKPRQVFAGIRKAYAPEDLVGKSVVMVANLAPRKMRFGISEGMILAASNDDGALFTISPDAGAKPGARLH